MDEAVRIRVVVPARNAGSYILACLSGLFSAGFGQGEVVVVDDGSTDDTAALAAEMGVRVISHPVGLGAAAARNRGALGADADVLFFVDADVAIHADVRARLVGFFAAQAGVDAVFGAYDDAPTCRAVTSKYRNLLHHYVHCHGPAWPKSFWTGCGAVRRGAFERLGGFDERQRMMEDVEFGMRLTQSGGVVALDPGLRGKHLKSWSVSGMARADLLDRAVPWTRLMLFGPGLTRDLNLDGAHRLSAVLTALMGLGVLCAPVAPLALALTGASTAAFIAVNRPFLQTVRQSAGLKVALAAVPLHVLHYGCALLGFGWVFAAEYLPRRALAVVGPIRLWRSRNPGRWP